LVITKERIFEIMDFYNCFDGQGKIIARCQTDKDINVLKKMGRPIAEVRQMKNEEAVVCSLTGSPSDFNMDY
tara:strand:- start:107 stop:322 length:216 start_codon:yes stop_codon:yes gene_type:complete